MMIIIKGAMSRKVMKFHDTQNAQKSRMKHCKNHVKVLNNIKNPQQNEIEAWIDSILQD